MSGAGHGIPRGAPQVAEQTRCGDLRFETILASPVEEVVERIEVGVSLAVVLERTAMPDIQRVVASLDGALAGSIIERLGELIRCLQDGYRFLATVLDIDDGIVRVEVNPA